MTGTAVGQIMTAAAAPLLSRIYSPDEFGLLGVFAATAAIFGNIAALKYELAIVVPKSEGDAVNVFALGVAVVVGMALVTAGLVGIFGDPFSNLLRSPGLRPVLWYLPFHVLVFGIYQVLSYWNTRCGQFARQAASRMCRSAGTVATQIACGLAQVPSNGLVIGQLTGQAVALAALAIQFARDDLSRVRNNLSPSKILDTARQYIAFPRYNTPQTLVNSISQTIPAFLLGTLFGPTVVGLYWFTHRLLYMPIDLITQSVRQVFFHRASHLYNSGGDVWALLWRATAGLCLIGMLPTLIILVGGSSLFGFIFGEDWAPGGAYARWLMLWFFFAFINAPSVMLIPLYNLQKLHAVYELFLLCMRIGAIYIGGLIGGELLAVAAFALVGVVFNALLIATIFMITYQGRVRAAPVPLAGQES